MSDLASSQPPYEASADRLSLAEMQCRLGQVWRRRGKPDQARLNYLKALALDPACATAYIELGRLLGEQGRVSEAIEVFQRGLAHNPNSAQLHKDLVAAWVEAEGLAAAYAYYELERCDAQPVDLAPDAVLCCTVVRNEALRLPYFLDYYRAKGIHHFFMVDNGSTDGTLAYLLDQPDVHVWRSSLSFNRANFGAAWFEIILREYGRGHWCLIVDADELLYYAGCENRSIPTLCRDLERQAKRALSGMLLDMYSDRPIQATLYTPGQPFLEVCPFFDRQFYHDQYADWTPYRNMACYFGGMRQRVFGAQGRYILSKVPLIQYDLDCTLIGGQHWTNRPREEIAVDQGCLLHFKYFASFPAYVAQEVARQEHYDQAMQYVQYARSLEDDPSLTLYDPQVAVRFEGSQQLIALGILKPAPRPALPSLEFPPIASLPSDPGRPLWSVMITAYNRLDFLPRALRSVLDQAPDPASMQIEVVNDGADAATQARLAALVAEMGGGHVSFYRHPTNVGHPHIFNVCIERAQGRWVHILHDDDWVAPGFYTALAAGIHSAPHVGAAFCRYTRVDAAGAPAWTSWLERETPGVIENWLARIAVMCCLQFAAVVVCRQAYEAVGGFSPLAQSAFDWDMWKRIALHYPVWYEPEPRAFFFQGETSESHRLTHTGAQIAHARQAIELAHRYLPPEHVAEWTQAARLHYANQALKVAREQWQAGHTAVALATVREGLRCSPTPALKQTLAKLLAQTAGRLS